MTQMHTAAQMKQIPNETTGWMACKNCGKEAFGIAGRAKAAAKAAGECKSAPMPRTAQMQGSRDSSGQFASYRCPECGEMIRENAWGKRAVCHCTSGF